MQHVPPAVQKTFVLELQQLGRVVLFEESQQPSGRSLLVVIAERQADYLSRHMVIGDRPSWPATGSASAAARRWLIRLKLQVDDVIADENLARLFADSVVEKVDTMRAVQNALEGRWRSAA